MISSLLDKIISRRNKKKNLVEKLKTSEKKTSMHYYIFLNLNFDERQKKKREQEEREVNNFNILVLMQLLVINIYVTLLDRNFGF